MSDEATTPDATGTQSDPASIGAEERASQAAEATAAIDDSPETTLDADQTAETETTEPDKPETAESKEEPTDAQSEDESEGTESTTEGEEDEVEKILAESEVDKDLDPTEKAEKLLKTNAKLRRLLTESNTKLKEATANVEQEPTLNESEFLDDLNAFDVDTGTPTAKPFVEKLYAADPQSAERLLNDLMRQPVDEKGQTLGHQYMEALGLDPTRLSEFRKISRGEISPELPGAIPDVIPPEYADAYKTLSPANRDKVLDDLEMAKDETDPDEAKALQNAALETLDNVQYRINETQRREREQAEADAALALDVENDVITGAKETYTNLFETLENGEAFKAKLSTNPQMDTALKSSILGHMTALGDPDTVLGARAQSFFKDIGIQVDMSAISSLMHSIEENLRIASVATRKGFQTNARNARDKVTEAQAELTALGNKYFAQCAKRFGAIEAEASESQKKALEQNAGLPTVTGTAVQTDGAKKPLTLEQRADIAAKQIKELSA